MMQAELSEYRNSHQQDITDAVSAMDTYTHQADVQQDKLEATESELQRTVLVLQGVVDICNQTQAELSDAMQAKQELEQQARQQNGHLQDALSFIRDLLRDKGLQLPAQVQAKIHANEQQVPRALLHAVYCTLKAWGLFWHPSRVHSRLHARCMTCAPCWPALAFCQIDSRGSFAGGR